LINFIPSSKQYQKTETERSLSNKQELNYINVKIDKFKKKH